MEILFLPHHSLYSFLVKIPLLLSLMSEIKGIICVASSTIDKIGLATGVVRPVMKTVCISRSRALLIGAVANAG